MISHQIKEGELMKKKDFLTLLICNLGTLVLFVEHFIGLEIAGICLWLWTILSLIIHIAILKEYIIIGVEIVEEDI
jgi:hypothetical protein